MTLIHTPPSSKSEWVEQQSSAEIYIIFEFKWPIDDKSTMNQQIVDHQFAMTKIVGWRPARIEKVTLLLSQ